MNLTSRFKHSVFMMLLRSMVQLPVGFPFELLEN